MVDITELVNGVYKPTYNWAAPSGNYHNDNDNDQLFLDKNW